MNTKIPNSKKFQRKLNRSKDELLTLEKFCPEFGVALFQVVANIDFLRNHYFLFLFY